MIQKTLLVIGIICINFMMASCGIFGLHFKVHNPKHAVSYPAFSKEQLALAALNQHRICYHVSYYKLDINFDIPNQQIAGWVTMSGNFLTATDTMQIDLAATMQIDSVCWVERNGQQLSYTRDERAIKIAVPTQASKAPFTIHIKYHGNPKIAPKAPWQGGFVWKKDKQKNPWVGVACESEGASLWFPCKDLTNDEPDSVDLNYTIPESELTIVGNGVFAGKKTENGNNTFQWKVRNPINLYNITFYIGNFVPIYDNYVSEHGNLAITHYVLKPNEEKAREHFKAAKEHIRVYESIYGPYAWYKDGFKLVESPYAGMEHQTAIAYGNGFKNNLMNVEDYIMLHEIGHEWFGNAITAADLADVWLQEGITTYGEALYLEKKYSKALAQQHMQFYKWAIKNKRPLVGPYEHRYFNYKDGDVYVKGAWMLHSLRSTIQNDSLFFSVLQTFYHQYAKKTTNSKDFAAVVNKVCGKDYDWFFNQYLHNNKVPFLEYTQQKGILYYKWKFVASDFNAMPVTLVLEKGEGLTLYPSDKLQQVTLDNDLKNIKFSLKKENALYGVIKSKKLVRQR